jgi:hypothetical protein
MSENPLPTTQLSDRARTAILEARVASFAAPAIDLLYDYEDSVAELGVNAVAVQKIRGDLERLIEDGIRKALTREWSRQ